MKHRYLVMWHPHLKWGSPLPTLQPSKMFVAKATGVTQQTIRKNGWLWCKVVIDTPETGDPVKELRRLDEMIAELQAEAHERYEELTATERSQYRAPVGGDGAPD